MSSLLYKPPLRKEFTSHSDPEAGVFLTWPRWEINGTEGSHELANPQLRATRPTAASLP